jgi:hypothetical protein
MQYADKSGGGICWTFRHVTGWLWNEDRLSIGSERILFKNIVTKYGGTCSMREGDEKVRKCQSQLEVKALLEWPSPKSK